MRVCVRASERACERVRVFVHACFDQYRRAVACQLQLYSEMSSYRILVVVTVHLFLSQTSTPLIQSMPCTLNSTVFNVHVHQTVLYCTLFMSAGRRKQGTSTWY